MFVDEVKIQVKAGKGGDGAVSFHREKYVPNGGPDGGDGGKGGDIIFVSDDHLSTLLDLSYKKKYHAPSGENGKGNRCYGKKGKDMLIKVPKGTLIYDQKTNRLMADLSGNQPVIIAKGGRGGWGNAHFATATRQIPRFAKPGQPGEEWDLRLELKLLADVGLIGFPNAGKSTILSVVSAAKPKIADYPFTTLSPVLGLVRGEEQSFVMADIPGLIEGASEGSGLGHTFLRHIQRCRLLVHVVDVSGLEGRDPWEDFQKINQELSLYDASLSSLPQIIAANKTDVAPPEKIKEFQKKSKQTGCKTVYLSAATKKGVRELVREIEESLSHLPPIRVYQPDDRPIERKEKSQKFQVRFEEGKYYIEAPFLLKILRGVSMDDYESLQYFQRVLQKSGILDELKKMGIREGDTVQIEDWQFDYME